MKKSSICAWVVLSMLFILGGCSHTSYLESDTPEDEVEAAVEDDMDPEDGASSEKEATPSKEEGTLFVQVAGAVKSPGVYELPQGARVFEAIELAGGLKKNADDVSLNQAQLLSDGEKIYVCRAGEQEESAADGSDVREAGVSDGVGGFGSGNGSNGGASVDGKININTAGADELKTLSGIGDAKAQAILSYREAHGGFQSVDELTQVDGIGDATLLKLKDYITI
ncbi:MAG: helix-hairpin-helix domain-containing protein [Lachnospiraceae bacterium]|nr:helix-hairpin-helix domain-containing protein [Lachnospiraceae bacterium]